MSECCALTLCASRFGEAEGRSICGEASTGGAKELVAEGSPVVPLARLPEDESWNRRDNRLCAF